MHCSIIDPKHRTAIRTRSWRDFRLVGTESFDVADDVAVAGQRREDVEASAHGGDVAGLLKRVCAAQDKAAARTGQTFPIIVDPGGGAGRVLDPPRAARGRHREPRGRSRLDRDVATATAGEDGQDRWRGAGAGSAGVQARRAAGLRDGSGTDARGGGPPRALSRAQDLDRRADRACEPDQGPAVRPRHLRL